MPSHAYKTSTNILLIEDMDSDAELIRLQLADTETEAFTVFHAPDMAHAIPILAAQKLQAVMLDLFLPDTNELDGLASVQAAAPDVPVLILTGRDDDALAHKAVGCGAQDYLIKGQMDSAKLQRSLRYAMQRKHHENVILHQAYYDTLTGLPNRDLFKDRLQVALARQQRSHEKIGLMMLDLNGFKAINDTHGHATGDIVLKEIGRRIPQCLRPYDVAARLGGDEFAVLIEDVNQTSDHAEIARKLIQIIERPIVAHSVQLKVGVSIGIVTTYGEGTIEQLRESLLRESDAAMYRAKSKGSSAFEFFNASKSHPRFTVVGQQVFTP